MDSEDIIGHVGPLRASLFAEVRDHLLDTGFVDGFWLFYVFFCIKLCERRCIILCGHDRQVLIQMFILRKLANKGAAQALYTFLESLPEKPIPLSFARIKRRLMLTLPNNQQNRVINKAIDELEAIGYLDGDVVKRDG